MFQQLENEMVNLTYSKSLMISEVYIVMLSLCILYYIFLVQSLDITNNW